ncbi:MAG TPA: penicillin-binding protein [Firmicutes bacterium]|nr:penicillin-binding protein [Bacillota bacterium]
MKQPNKAGQSAPSQKGGKSSGAVKRFMKKKPVRVTRKVFAAIMKCILTIFLIGTITVSIVGCIMVVYVIANVDSSSPIDLDDLRLNESSIVYAKNSAGEWEEIQRVEGTNSIWTDLADIPVDMQNAVIAIEDKRFREHNGVDWIRTVSAAVNMVFHFRSNTYGGSTITQQLIKNITDDDDVKISRKVREIFRAIDLEKNATKNQILEAYLNILPLSGNITGVGAAANYYFGKDVQDLSLAECALIAGITQNPSRYNPYLHPDNIKQRQKVVLQEMYRNGFITEDEYIQAYNEELVFRSNMKRVGVQDYYADQLTEDVIDALVENYGYTEEYAEQLYFHGGLKIYSCENPELQEKVEAVFEDDANFPEHHSGDKEDPQAAMAVIDYQGRLVATVGGRGEKTANRILNRSTTSVRQPGSSMKPIAVYAPAIDLNLITYSTIMDDHPMTLEDGSRWPRNFDNYYNGNVTIESAVKWSLNTIPAKLIMELTPERSFDFLTNNLHITTLVRSKEVNGQILTDIVPSLALGGLTDGVRCLEMAAAYQVFGNGGYYNEPYTFERVERNNQVILQNSSTNVHALDENTAYIMNQLLQRVIDGGNGATGRGYGVNGFTTFAKTGTTTDTKDVYYVGGTPYYVGACWFGYDDNEEIHNSDTTYARRLWQKAMNALHEGLDAKEFTQPSTVVKAVFCQTTGLLANTGCSSTGVGYYKPDNVPGYCTTHGGSPNAGISSDSTTPATTTSTSAQSTLRTTADMTTDGSTTSTSDSTTSTTSEATSEQQETDTTADPSTTQTPALPPDTDDFDNQEVVPAA